MCRKTEQVRSRAASTGGAAALSLLRQRLLRNMTVVDAGSSVKWSVVFKEKKKIKTKNHKENRNSQKCTHDLL